MIGNKMRKIHHTLPNFNKQNQEGHALKILTTQQMLSRLPISLAQLKSRNNS